jgi:hypothetical protein
MTRWLSPVLIASLAVAGTASAQTSDVLNSFEVQRLVAGDDSNDHAALSVHFAALAASYDAQTSRHDAFARGFAGNPNRRFATEPGAAWARRAETTRQWAATARELAAHHARLAFGMPSIAPEGAGAFHGGRGAPEPTPAELRALASSASTPNDHLMLEEYYLVRARRADDTAARHAAMVAGFRGTPRRTLSGDGGLHCDRHIKQARDEAEDARVRALIHRQLAEIAG